MRIKFFSGRTLGVLSLFILLSCSAECKEYLCEVMSVQGEASVLSGSQSRPIRQGDLLKVGDSVHVEKGSYVDLAYDSEWKNLSRIGEDSIVKIRSIYPTGLFMEKGDILAKLRQLPNQSTFEVETPSAIAAVRGSEYRTIHREGETNIYNFHDSPVEVYSKTVEGDMIKEGVTLRQNEKTEIKERGDLPKMPEVIQESDLNNLRGESAKLEGDYQSKISAGEFGNTQQVGQVEREIKEELRQQIEIVKAQMAVNNPDGASAGNQNTSAASSGGVNPSDASGTQPAKPAPALLPDTAHKNNSQEGVKGGDLGSRAFSAWEQEKDSFSGPEEHLSATEGPSAVSERVSFVADRATSTSDRTEAVTEKVTTTSEQANAVAEKAAGSADRAVAISERVTTVSEQANAVAERAAGTADRAAEMAERVTTVSEQASAAAERATSTSERVAALAERATQSGERAAAASESAAERAAAMADRIQNRVDSISDDLLRRAQIEEERRRQEAPRTTSSGSADPAS